MTVWDCSAGELIFEKFSGKSAAPWGKYPKNHMFLGYIRIGMESEVVL